MHEVALGEEISTQSGEETSPSSYFKDSFFSLPEAQGTANPASLISPIRATPYIPDKKAKSKNWLTPAGSDKDEKSPDVKPSGWGWLADDLKELQQQRNQTRQDDEEEMERPLTSSDDSPSKLTLQKPDREQPAKPSPLQSSAFEPVQSRPLLTSPLDDSPDSLLAGRNPMDNNKSPAARLPVERMRPADSRSFSAQPKNEMLDRGSGTDAAWGLERTRSRQTEAPAGLTQTATILKDISASTKGSAFSMPGSLSLSGKPELSKTLSASSPFTGSGSSIFKNQDSAFRPVSSDLGSSFMTDTRKASGSLSGQMPLSSQPLGQFNSLQSPPKDFRSLSGR